MCVYRNFTCDNRISQPTHSYMYMPDEVFRDWKSIRIKEEEVKESIFSAIFFYNISSAAVSRVPTLISSKRYHVTILFKKWIQ